MSSATDFLTFPTNFGAGDFAEKPDKICIVTVIGKSRFTPFNSKASMLNTVVDRDIFQGIESEVGEFIQKGDLECYYDEETQVLYIHLISHHDTFHLAHHCRQMVEAKIQEDFYSYIQEAELKHARMLLMVFSLSHLILLVHPGCVFDMVYIKLFRILDSIRLKLQPQLIDLLKGLSVSKEWCTTARLCSPRVLFVFQNPSLPNTEDDSKSSRGPRLTPAKRLQHNLEDQIYRILRRARVITNISNNSLFAVPANQEFVYVCTRKNEVTEPVSFLLSMLRNHFSDTPKSKTCVRKMAAATSMGDAEGLRSPCLGRQENSFKEFLWQHIEMAFTKGFDDNVGRNAVAARFELPSAATWVSVCRAMHKFLFTGVLEGRALSALNSLKSSLDPDLRFSESRCNKIITMAESKYQQDLPPFFISSFHQKKLAQAKRVFAQFARGPAFDKYLTLLEDNCTAVWKNGRQQCEAISLSGSLCVNQLHRALSDAPTEDNKNLPIMAHSSQLKTRATCNCGRQQADKDDPFDHRSANYDFYMTLEAACCGTLPHIDLPFFKPSSSYMAAVTSPTIAKEMPEFKEVNENTVPETKDVVAGMSALSLAMSLGHSGGGHSDLFQQHENPQDVELDTSPHDLDLSQSHLHQAAREEEAKEDASGLEGDEEEISVFKDGEYEPAKQEQAEPEHHEGQATLAEEQVTLVETTDKADSTEPELEEVKCDNCLLPQRQHSTTEYLIGMLHTNSPPGLLPKFPSWSLCCLDEASFYNHQHGLDLPGFLTGSNFLLPWDIPVHMEKERWPTINETKRGRNIRRSTQKSLSDVTENTVRVFIGMEYECPRGHRFFCSAPDKAIKVLGNTSVKDTANRLVNMEMPLYTPCHCHTPKGLLAQMMRVYAVTPEGPLQVMLNPQVRPAPPPCPIFHPGAGSIELPPNGVWVLRLPHVYIGDSGPIGVPSEPQHLHSCVMLKGLFSSKEISPSGG